MIGGRWLFWGLTHRSGTGIKNRYRAEIEPDLELAKHLPLHPCGFAIRHLSAES